LRPSESELSHHCRDSLGSFKVPQRFAFVEALPKSPLGKVLKASLRQQFSSVGATSATPAGRTAAPRAAAEPRTSA
jgi:acyl-coenzyme A synthetase/AMP-(fatty) acid ligase